MRRVFRRPFSARVAALRARLEEEAASPRLAPLPRPAPTPAQYPPFVAPELAGAPSRHVLDDRFARRHTYLRISLTERCSLRCVYCMPAAGVDLTPKAHLLDPDEMLRIATAFVDAGVNKIRLTGGEPAVRKDLVDVVAALDGLRPRGLDEISITSNGLALAKKLPALQAAGLDRLNVSLDTLEREKFNTLTRRDALPKVLETIDQALGLGLPLKVNCVLMRGTNEDEVLDFAAMTAARPLDVRFIEYMPFDGNRWEEQKIVPYAELLAELKGAHPEVEPVVTHAHDVARTWRLPGAAGTVSFIASMTQPFCAGCNRLRLTADGSLKVCLFGDSEVSLRDALRGGASDAQLMDLVSMALGRKHAQHAGAPAAPSPPPHPASSPPALSLPRAPPPPHRRPPPPR